MKPSLLRNKAQEALVYLEFIDHNAKARIDGDPVQADDLADAIQSMYSILYKMVGTVDDPDAEPELI